MNHTLKEAISATKKPWSDLDRGVYISNTVKWDEPCVSPGMGPQTRLSYLGAGGGGGISKAKE